jgi:hypothetical protein
LPYQVANPEIVYFFERLFEPMVVATMRRHIATLPSEYELFPTVYLSSRSQEAMSHTREATANQMRYRFDQVRMVLEVPRKRYGPEQEILRRPKKKMSTPDASKFVMCQIQGCSRIACLQSKCPDCNIYRCVHPDHYSHASHSDLEIAVGGGSSEPEQPASAQPIASSGRGSRGRGRDNIEAGAATLQLV